MAADDSNPQRVSFVLGQALPFEETRSVEFKEITGNDPVRTIVNASDEYAVAFLNSDGGRIYWGIRDSDRVIVGVRLSGSDRDRLRKDVSAKLHTIQPSIDPTLFLLSLHPVEGGSDLFVVELVMPRSNSTDPFYTAGNVAFVRIDGVKRKLAGPPLTDWIKRRMRRLAASETVEDPKAMMLVDRVRCILSEHGLELGHMHRFLEQRNAPFSIELSDFQSDGAFLNWLSEEKIKWVANTFLIRREWIDGEDGRIHDQDLFDKQPAKFFSTVSQHLDAFAIEDIPALPEAYFIRWGQGREWRWKGNYQVFFVLAVPLARLSNERFIYKYISDFFPYRWDYPRTHIQLRAWARLLSLVKNVYCQGYEIPYRLGEELHSNSSFLYRLLESPGVIRRTEWNPEDYALYPSESCNAKDTENLPLVIDFLREHGLPCEEVDRRQRRLRSA